MTEETLKMIMKRDELWMRVRKEGKKLGDGWEEQMKKQKKDNAKERAHNDQWNIVWASWQEWEEIKNKVRLEVRKNKINYHKKLIRDIGQPEGEANLWKAIDKMCYRKVKTNQTYAVKKEDGGWCETDQEELEEIKAFCCRELKQKAYTQDEEAEKDGKDGEEGEQDKEEWQEKMRATMADVREAYRKTHHSKSTPAWSPPNKLCDILKDQICGTTAKAWTKLGYEKCSTQWVRQKVVWIPKPGKN